MQVMLQQAVIPFSIILSMLLLKARYHYFQYFGAAVIVCGVIVSKWNTIFGAADPNDVDDRLGFNLIFVCAGIPMALSSVYKEIAFSGIDLDINLLQGWVA